jgi:hypothetical protein
VVRDADPPPRFGSRIPRHTLRVPRPPAPRFTCSRTAPPSREPLPSSPATMSAAPASRASRVRRTATLRGSTGAESITTSANALLRSRTSAHQAARVGSRGRTIQSPSSLPNGAQSRGASVRIASMYAGGGLPSRCRARPRSPSTGPVAARRRRVPHPAPRHPSGVPARWFPVERRGEGEEDRRETVGASDVLRVLLRLPRLLLSKGN